jgi:O-methyltransferase involved in polyketide biosynthesis
MICHTLIFSFGEGRTPSERDEFLAKVTEICLSSRMARQVETRVHLPLANDSYAQTFVSSAIVQLFSDDLDTIEKLSGYAELVKFEHDEQQTPYSVVWINHEPIITAAA